MAGRVQAVCRIVAEDYGNKADNIWKGVEQRRTSCSAGCSALPGFGEQKAKIFVALLGKQLGRPARRLAQGHHPLRQAEGSSLSVADITDPESLAKVGPPRRR